MSRKELAAQSGIRPGFSVYLDLVRVVAALDVMAGHAQLSGLAPPLGFILDSGPTAVTVFFVLSGYIIESTTRRGSGWRPYAVHRIARITSVAWPAIALSFACAGGFAMWMGPNAIAQFIADWCQWWRIPAALAFFGQNWFYDVKLPWNGPYWSMHFEVAYYFIYGFLLLPTAWIRWPAVLLFSVFAGPKILLLFPCWWLGVALARRPSLALPGQKEAFGVLVATPIIIALLVHFHAAAWFNQIVGPHFAWYSLVGHAEAFPVRYVEALLVGANFMAARHLEDWLVTIFDTTKRFIRWIAGYTFSIYLFHRPLQNLAEQFYQVNVGSFITGITIHLAILMVILALGFCTERRTAAWRARVDRWLPPRKSESPASR